MVSLYRHDCLGGGSRLQRRAGHGRRTLSSVQAQDVNRIIAYGSGRTALKYIAFSALVLVVGIVVAFGRNNWLLGVPLAAVAAVVIVWQINGLLTAKPLLLLSPAGLRLNLDGYVFVDIPWREVAGISSLDLTFEVVKKRWYDLSGDRPRYSLGKDQYRGVTALQVSEAFADKTVLPLWRAVNRNSRGLRRFGIGIATFTLAPNATASRLGNIFPTQDGKRFVTLPHSVLSVGRDQLRAEIEARWQAFGEMTAKG
ncbi:hypothetical protein [Mesorhizobium sp. NZP2077]|uniref:hypothetical protein n=1 Tax=Mesorhizobium sp. NZP2077 TaxID=2483404 RepID=UPI0015552C57|nr:hypothetical protein [Mesorhizobium sp. NZP2077]QKD15878.1 hypothetical protein HGP13_12670 [Mesorhizobium sp. NZP2077]